MWFIVIVTAHNEMWPLPLAHHLSEQGAAQAKRPCVGMVPCSVTPQGLVNLNLQPSGLKSAHLNHQATNGPNY